MNKLSEETDTKEEEIKKNDGDNCPDNGSNETEDVALRICQENLKKSEDKEEKFNTEIRAQETMRE